MTDWEVAQEWERRWWGNCTRTYGEETKQLLYANRMGLTAHHDGKSPFNFDLGGASVLDIGGGPCSLLLKCTNLAWAKVADPLLLPDWVLTRYSAAKIAFERAKGEEINEAGFDEAWIYNVLQHTEDPQEVIARAQRAARLIRVFEWIGTPTNVGHLHTLTEARLNEWLGGAGKVEKLTGQNTCTGVAYYGVFPA